MRIRRSFFPVIFGAIFALVGCIVLLVFGQTATLDCERVESTQISCEKQSRLLGMTVSRRSISRLQGARMDESCDEDGCTYRVELRTDQGIVPLTAFYSSGSQSKQKTADQINAFVQDSKEKSLTFKEGMGWLGIVFPGVFVVTGMLVAVFGGIRAITG